MYKKIPPNTQHIDSEFLYFFSDICFPSDTSPDTDRKVNIKKIFIEHDFLYLLH